MRRRHLSSRTEQIYVQWIRRYILFHDKRHPREMAEAEVASFLDYLTGELQYGSASRNQCLNALTFLYRHVLKMPLEGVQFLRARRPASPPVILSSTELESLFETLDERHRLLTLLLYGSGLRLQEAVSLRVRDVDMKLRLLRVHNPESGTERLTMIPDRLHGEIAAQLASARDCWKSDRRTGIAGVELPLILGEECSEQGIEWRWFWLFPAPSLVMDRASACLRRRHRHPRALQRAIKRAALKAGIEKKVTCHCLRHSFAAHLLENGTDIQLVQDLLGHRSLTSTLGYLKVVRRPRLGARSPLDMTARGEKQR